MIPGSVLASKTASKTVIIRNKHVSSTHDIGIKKVATKSPKRGLQLYRSTNFLNSNKGPQQSLKSMERVSKKTPLFLIHGSEHATHPPIAN